MAKTLGLKGASSYQRYENPETFTKDVLPNHIINKLVAKLPGNGNPPITKSEIINLGGIESDQADSVLDKLKGENSQFKKTVPLISSVRAGAWTDIGEVRETHQVEKWMPTTIKVGPRAFALKVIGQSMQNPYGQPSIPEGAIVIVDPDREAESGNIVVAQEDAENEATIKKLDKDGSRVYLKPLNPNYETLKLDKKTGRVIGVVRGMTFTQEFED